MKKLFFLLSATVLLSCSSETSESEVTESPEKDTAVTEVMSPDVDTASVQENTTEPEISAESSSIESFEKASAGPSFCDCVKKQQELDEQLAAAEDDKLVEELLQKSEELRNGECQVLKAGPQMTSAQKKERERKVKACLGN